MPIYLYECQTCRQTHEILQKFSDPFVSKCPACGGPVQKKFSPAIGLSFKGSGFYITDYKNGRDGSQSTPQKSTAPAEKQSA